VLAGRPFCLMHDPASADMRREAGRKGGHARSNQKRARKAMPTALTSDELLVTLSRAIDKVEKGELEPGPANAIASLARAMNSIRETTEIERRLSELEQRAGVADSRWRA
jgi:hypothetical protein